LRTLGFASALVTIIAASGAYSPAASQTPDPASVRAPAASADNRLDPRWLRAGTDTMIMTRAGDISSVSFHRAGHDDSPGRHEIGMTIQTVRSTDQMGHAALEVGFEEQNTEGVVALVTTWVDASTLLPLRQEAHLDGDRVITLVYGGGQALGVDLAPGRESHTFNMTVPDSAYTAGEIDLLLRSLPLAADYRTTVPVYFPADKALFPLPIRVAGRETITTRAGRAADCWLVAVDFPGGVTEQFWIEAQDHGLVRILAHDSPTTLVRYDR
jgi:hypothetical protein